MNSTKQIFTLVLLAMLVLSLSCSENQDKSAGNIKTEDILAKLNIELGSDKKVTPDNHRTAISLNQIEQITKTKVKQQHETDKDFDFYDYTWQDELERGEIIIFYLDSQKAARIAAIKMFFQIEQGRATTIDDITVSRNEIGDYMLQPKEIEDDPHGFKMPDSDKTFLAFAKDNIAVAIDSKRNANPHFNVFEYARQIESLLNNATKHKLNADQPAPAVNSQKGEQR